MTKSNPFKRPLVNQYLKFRKIIKSKGEWKFPLIPAVITLLLILISIALLSTLYITIGLVSQIYAIIWSFIRDARGKITAKSDFTQACGYLMAIAIYFVLLIPFGLIQAPFWLLGYGFIYFFDEGVPLRERLIRLRDSTLVFSLVGIIYGGLAYLFLETFISL